MSPESSSAQSRRPRPSVGTSNRAASSLKKKPTRATTRSLGKGQAVFITEVGATSIFRISVLFYSFLMLTFLVAGVILWFLLGTSGYEAKLNHLIDSLLGSSTYHLIGLEIFIAATALGVVWVVISAALTTVAVKMFNLAIDLVGGFKIYLKGARAD